MGQVHPAVIRPIQIVKPELVSFRKKMTLKSAICDRYLKIYFGKKDIDKIGDADINGYRDWRNAYWITGEGKSLYDMGFSR